MRRPVRGAGNATFLLVSAALVFCTHWWVLSLPYFWDEAGQFVPAALDLFRHGEWIPRSTAPNIHPPGVMLYLALVWTLAGCRVVVTRCAMLLLAALALFATYLLARQLSGSRKTAVLAAVLMGSSPLFFAQSALAQLDMPAMLFTTAALLLFLQERFPLCAAASLALVLVKETGVVVPLLFLVWLGLERRWRQAAWFAAPPAALVIWVLLLAHHTGHWAGNPDFLRYNLYYPLRPFRLGVSFLRRVYFLFFADLHFAGSAALVYAWRAGRLFRNRAWRVAWLLAALHVLLVTVLGGAVLERYLLPALPVLYTGMAAGVAFLRPAARRICAVALPAGFVASSFVNPPYPFPLENNLAFADFLKLHLETARYVAARYPAAGVSTNWPLTMELSRPELEFVPARVHVHPIGPFSEAGLRGIDWQSIDVLVAYSRDWDPPFNLMRLAPVRAFWRHVYGSGPELRLDEARARIPLTLAAHFERRGLWADVYVRPPGSGRTRPGTLADAAAP